MEGLNMTVNWDGTWTQSRRHTVEGALERIERMLTNAYISVQAVSRVADQMDIYVQHFDDANMANLGRVTDVIRLMHTRITSDDQNVTMSYVPDHQSFLAVGVGPLPQGVAIDDVEAFVTQRNVGANDPLTVYVCPSFFTGDVYIPNGVNQRTGTGTILHELSHGVAGTDDHAYTWSNGYAMLSANQRANNADSYRAYCQSFDM
jgi:hypothetical protein